MKFCVYHPGADKTRLQIEKKIVNKKIENRKKIGKSEIRKSKIGKLWKIAKSGKREIENFHLVQTMGLTSARRATLR